MSSLSSPSILPGRYVGDLNGEESGPEVPLRHRGGRGKGLELPPAEDLGDSSRVRSDGGQAERLALHSPIQVSVVGRLESPLTASLVERLPPPNVDLTNFIPAKLSSVLRGGDSTRLRAIFHIPPGVELLIPGVESRAHLPPMGWFCVYEDQLLAGVRFPLHPFLSNLLNYYRIPLA